jgi:hypothetical protein
LLPPDSSTWEPSNFQPSKFCYTGPDFRNPTGDCLTRDERTKLLELADGIDMLILEDGCYEKLRYDGESIPSVLALEVARKGSVDAGRVIYTNTFSKTISPSLRVGWVVAPAVVIRKLVLIKQAGDLVTSTLNQMIAYKVASTYLGGAVEHVNSVYRARRDLMQDALEKHMPPGVTWVRPEGGLYVWLELPPELDGDEVSDRALAEKAVSIVSGSTFYPVDPKRNTLRLSFSMAEKAQLDVGAERLGDLLREMIAAS